MELPDPPGSNVAFLGGIASITPDGQALASLPMPDPLTTNICFDGGERDAFLTLSGTGRLVRAAWEQHQYAWTSK